MPRVPTYDNFQATPAGGSGIGQYSTAGVGIATDINNRQNTQISNSLMQAGATATAIATDMQQQVNRVRIDDAHNQLLEYQNELTFGQEGYANIKGKSALERPDNMPLSQSYSEKMQSRIGEMAASLGNDAQKQQFQQIALQQQSQFKAKLQQHETQEYKNYSLSVREGAIKIHANQIGLNYNDPAILKASSDAIRANTLEMARINGKSALEAEAVVQETLSGAYKTAMSAMLENGNINDANTFFNQHKQNLTANDSLAVQKVLKEGMSQELVSTITNDVSKMISGNLSPTDSSKLHHLVGQQESGNSEYDANGNVMTSNKGARGSMQVLDATNKDPGFGVKPAQDDSLEERARVGRDYIDALVNHYGDLPKALAAYNWGAGNLDKAIAKYGNDWLSAAPTETKNYVKNITGKFYAGDGAPEQMTREQAVQHGISQLGANANTKTIADLTNSINKIYTEQEKDKKQKDEMNTSAALDYVIKNNGDMSGMPPALRAAIPPNDYGKVFSLSEKLSKGEDVKTEWGTYTQLMQDPDLLRNTNLSLMADKLAPTELKQLINLQTDLKSAKIKDVSLRTTVNVLTGYFKEAGIEDEARKGKATAFIQDNIEEEQRRLGKELSSKEKQEIIVKAFTMINGTGFGDNKYTFEQSSDVTLKIPNQERLKIIDALIQGGIKPTEEEIQKVFKRAQGIR